MLHCDNDALVNAIEARFPPNVLGGLLGTGRGQIVRALRSAGLRVTSGYSGLLGAGRPRCWQRVRDAVAAGTPVAVLVDAHVLGGSRLHGHWAVLWNIERDNVYLANWNEMPVVPVERFLRAWACPAWSPGGIAYGFTHSYVFCESSPRTPSWGQNP